MVAELVVEQEGHGVREDFTQQPACQVPQIACPHPLYTVASGELRKDRVYPVAKPGRLRKALLFGVGSLFLEEYGARSSMPKPANSCLVFGEW